jgi:uncharacterized Ntn-hydrolase superfamily protein
MRKPEQNLSQLVHTYSIIAVDRDKGLIGGAVQSHYFSVGSVVLWGEPGVGMVATQSLVNPAFGPNGLTLLREGGTPAETAEALQNSDAGIVYRQFGIIDTRGRTAAFTGEKCIPYAGHVAEEGLSAQANMMLHEGVPEAMVDAFTAGVQRAGTEVSEVDFASRLVQALQAAEKAGGDIRGRQSAHLLIIPIEKPEEPWKGRKLDLRVEDHPEPVEELVRLIQAHKAYTHHNAGDEAMERGDSETALREYKRAESLYPEQLELVFWHAVALANHNKIDEARPLFEKVFNADANWRELTHRLSGTGLISFDPENV